MLATRPQTTQLSEDDMRGWSLARDLLGVDDDQVIGQDSSFEGQCRDRLPLPVEPSPTHSIGLPASIALDTVARVATVRNAAVPER